MPGILTLETQRYAIKLDNFEGPLDLLCSLIEKNKMSIYDIKLDEITDQYIELLNKAQELNLEVASEFLSLASTLLYIKSKKLLPSKNEEEEELSEDELIRRIVEYKKYKDITVVLRQNFEENANRFYKLPENIELPKQQLDEKYEENIIPNLYKKLYEEQILLGEADSEYEFSNQYAHILISGQSNNPQLVQDMLITKMLKILKK